MAMCLGDWQWKQLRVRPDGAAEWENLLGVPDLFCPPAPPPPCCTPLFPCCCPCTPPPTFPPWPCTFQARWNAPSARVRLLTVFTIDAKLSRRYVPSALKWDVASSRLLRTYSARKAGLSLLCKIWQRRESRPSKAGSRDRDSFESPCPPPLLSPLSVTYRLGNAVDGGDEVSKPAMASALVKPTTKSVADVSASGCCP